MKDIMGIELEVGQEVIYFRSGKMIPEEAEVINIKPNSIEILFRGSRKYGKKKGQEGKVFNTTSRIFILDNTFAEIIKLREENRTLKKEVNKIHNRFDILDL